MINNNIYNQIANLIKNSNNIIVFTGAGISVNSGIPDFRGPNGLYNIVRQKFKLNNPEDIFDINYFIKNPEPFFELSKELFNTNIEPTLSHKFIAWLEEQNKISIVVTQNIDMLHQKAGSKKVIECHGSYQTLHCLNCKNKYIFDEIKNELIQGKILYCKCGGIIKPDVVFFGEQLPESFFKIYYNPPKCDLLITMGTSLQVQPAASFSLNLAQRYPSIIVNKTETFYDNIFTYKIYEDLDIFSKKIWDLLI